MLLAMLCFQQKVSDGHAVTEEKNYLVLAGVKVVYYLVGRRN